MKTNKRSQNWLNQHFNDPYVQKAHKEGWRSRAVFKLQAIDDKYKLIKSGSTIVDLGAAPGGWSQYVVNKLNGKGQVYALDCLDIDPLPQVEFIQGDFTEDDTLHQLEQSLKEQAVDCVLSDMAPNLSGHDSVDQPRAMYLAELAYEFACDYLKRGGHLLVKVFQGREFDEYLKTLKQAFQTVKVIKPDASKKQSREVYLLCIYKRSDQDV